ncbi:MULTISPECIES: fumarylacetoacetate hydrolase family protein [Okeania]|uniref:FAA hydrolase family protein n=1 Tax=Okeania hirsuta TaxID=1458930 RepID=A0A3N6NTQ2_9CYAN|nr:MULTISPECIES: fumarylacetoacetate hydrolase family protein [Okeania]NES79741.1 fumarylacetoacetate hydrolase family protein [Okeania sp. SIO1H4]NET18873.1 fumarylacetoacetate hydrolase family protein [Okeania sp. SIO1H5]NET80329.1 fumarylacetoacetate hydrolase family protein [Okeania sp. SIO1F9]NET93192.1 fumarylacetoacetate hydrolase family protein [Okeania sp. SIO1H2]RQH22333.1 FAA hydrolase family protein [Okeania hirsuta]
MSSLTIAKTIGSIYCVGRNYADHAKELNNPVPKEPIIFTKSPGCVVPFEGKILLPLNLGRCDYETEIAIQLGTDLYQADLNQVLQAISSVGIALDLTLRDRQNELRAKKYPWDLAKSFVNACPLSKFGKLNDVTEIEELEIRLEINGEVCQKGSTKQMLFSIQDLLCFISQNIPLRLGDIILTGTPPNVGPLNNNDYLVAFLNGEVIAEAEIIRN